MEPVTSSLRHVTATTFCRLSSQQEKGKVPRIKRIDVNTLLHFSEAAPSSASCSLVPSSNLQEIMCTNAEVQRVPIDEYTDIEANATKDAEELQSSGDIRMELVFNNFNLDHSTKVSERSNMCSKCCRKNGTVHSYSDGNHASSEGFSDGTDNDYDNRIIESCPHRTRKKVIRLKIGLPKNLIAQNNCHDTVNDISNGVEKDCYVGNKSQNVQHKTPKCPVMGKNALMTKMQSQNSISRTDTDIIHELVISRFSDFLVNYYEKSLRRRTSRIHSTSEENVVNDTHIDGGDTGYCAFKRNNMKHSSTMNDLRRKSNEVVLDDQGQKCVLSIDNDNIETSSDVATPSTGTIESSEDGEVQEEIVEYNAQEFLRQALGDEVNNIDSSVTTSNLSTLLSAPSQDGSNCVSSSKVSNNKHKKRSLTPKKLEPIEQSDASQPDYEECYYPGEKLSELITESSIQNQIVLQTSKALSFCKTVKEFASSPEEIEAERLLLVASRKRDALKEEIAKHISDNGNVNPMGNYGIVYISNLKFPPKCLTTVQEKRRQSLTQWYMCIANHGAKVFATKATRSDEFGLVEFREQFIFDKLLPDFEIELTIYCMEVRNNLKNYSHESKYHLNKTGRTMCPASPLKIFKLSRQPRQQEQCENLQRLSSFLLQGKITIRINDLKGLGHFKLFQMPLRTLLDGTLLMDLYSEVNIQDVHSSFLNIGFQTGDQSIVWNCLWCSLKDCKLSFYNHPDEELPMKIVDLKMCVTATVGLVDRTLCARPRTLLLETLAEDEGLRNLHSTKKYLRIVRHFLACNTADSLKEWTAKLNSSVATVRNWKSLGCNSQIVMR